MKSCGILLFQWSENKRKRKDKQRLGPYQRTKKNMWNMRVTVIQTVVGALETATGIGNERENQEHSDHVIVEID